MAFVGLEDLTDLGAGEIDDVAGELRARRRDSVAEPAVFGDAVAVDVPRDVGAVQTEQIGDAGPDVCGFRSERRGRAARPEQGDHGDPRHRLLETFAVAGELTQQRREGGAECGRHRLLGVGPAGHHGAGVGFDLDRERIAEFAELPVERGQRPRELQGEPGVHDVLRGRTVMDSTVRPVRQRRGDLPHQAQDRVADVLGRLPQGVAVDGVEPGGCGDRRGVVRREHPVRALRQCPLGREPAFDAAVRGEMSSCSSLPARCVSSENGVLRVSDTKWPSAEVM